MALLVLSLEQRAAALHKAGAARRARRALLDEITSGQTPLASVPQRAKSDPVIAETTLTQLLGWSSRASAPIPSMPPPVGGARARRFVSLSGGSPGVRRSDRRTSRRGRSLG